MEMDLIDVQRTIELMAEEAVLGQAKTTVWPDIEEKIELIPVTKIPPGTILCQERTQLALHLWLRTLGLRAVEQNTTVVNIVDRSYQETV